MIQQTLYITIPYFAIGALAFYVINRNSTDVTANKQRWIKYAIYFLIVHIVLCAAYLGKTYFLALSAIILLTVGYEILYNAITKARERLLWMAIPVYICFVIGFLLFANGRMTDVIKLYLMVVIFDGFSQITGQLFGRHKLLPSVSPGKTVEGTIGGTLFALLTIYLANRYTLSTGQFIGACALCITALMGDLLASWFKRLLYIKDYGHIIPGHGGVLDRFDSFIAVGAVYGFSLNVFHIIIH